MSSSTPPQSSQKLQDALNVFHTLNTDEQKQFISEATSKDLIDKLLSAASTARLSGQPATWVINYVWMAIISAFTAIFIFAAISVGLFAFQNTGKAPDVLITIFSTSVGFLAGVLTPSPVGSNNKPV